MALSLKISEQDKKKPLLRKSKLNDSQEVKKLTNKSISNDKKNKRGKILKYLIIFFVICLVGAGGYAVYKLKNASSDIGIVITPKDIIKPIVKDPELKRDSTGERTNFLLVGIDTRETNKGLQNTDTMIVGSYYHDTNTLIMLSIPRDTYVEMPGTPGWYKRINSVYSQAEHNEEGTGFESLVTAVTEYTDLEIQYYGMVDMKGFRNIIDIVGGIEVYVENSFTDDRYPDDKNGEITVSFEKGLQTLSAEKAIQYARSRHSLDNMEGSDYARAKRQQKVILAIKEKLLSSETLLNPAKIIEILGELQNNVKLSEFTNEDIQAGILIAKKEDFKSYTFVLDPNIGARKVIKEGIVETAFSIGPILGLGVYDDIHDLINRILENPEFYSQKPKIYTYDTGIGYYPAYELSNKLIEKYPFSTIIYRGTLFSDKTSIYVYDNSIDKTFGLSVTQLSKSLDKPINTKPDFVTTRLNGEDIVILFGKEAVQENPETTPTE